MNATVLGNWEGEPLRLPSPADTADRGPPVRSSMRLAYLVLAAFVLLFGLWAVLAPLHSAAVASGLLRADQGGRKVIQHLEGGIIKRLLVREGDTVTAGQALVELDSTATAAEGAALQANYDALLAQDARLSAERQGLPSVLYPDELLARREEPQVKAILRASDRLFRAGLGSQGDQVRVLAQRIAQSRAELGGTAPQLVAVAEQSRLIGEELAGVETLVGERLERRTRLLTLQRQQADLAAQRDRLTTSRNKLGDAIGELQAQVSLVRGQRTTEAAGEQRDVQARLADAREKLNISRDINRRRTIAAPVTGTVTNLRLVTPGGVLPAGQPILDIVPRDMPPVVIVRLHANDVDVVHPGLRAEVRLTPYKTRSVPTLIGYVRQVSADASVDDKTGEVYYETQVILPPAALRDVPSVRLVSGMPAEVFVQTGERSLFQYFSQPLIDSFRRAFRES